MAQEKSEAAAIRAETISCLHGSKTNTQDFYTLASYVNKAPPERQSLPPIAIDEPPEEVEKNNSFPEKYVTTDGTLQNIQNSDTINTIF